MVEDVDYQDKIIQTIKKIRLEKNINQAKLSELLGISRGQIGNIENPNYPHKYTLKQIVAICKHLDYPIEKIFIPEMVIAHDCSMAINALMERVVRYE